MTLPEYKKKSIEEIRKLGDAFKVWSDEDIADFYSQWSETNYSAGWIDSLEKQFYEYAMTTPIDLREKENNMLETNNKENSNEQPKTATRASKGTS